MVRLRRFYKNGVTLTSLLIIALYLVCALAPRAVAPHDPQLQETSYRFLPPMTVREDSVFLLGTDQLGRDVLSRAIYGSRLSLFISLTAVIMSMAIGVSVGTISGYCGGIVDSILMRVVDTVLAFPLIVLLIALVAILGPSLASVVIVLTFGGWAQYARLLRASVMSVKSFEYIEAGKALGASGSRIVFSHILPNVVSPIIVYATFHLTRVILIESTLSFLGLGVQSPAITWGSMIGDSRGYIYTAYWASVFPGLAMVIIVLSFNLVGDAIRDVLDPTLRV